MIRVALIAALPRELLPLVRGWAHQRRSGIDLWRHPAGRTEWVAACAGAGPEAARRAFDEALQTGTFDRVYSLGLAGALRAELQPGTVHRITAVIDTATGERWSATSGRASARECVLLTHSHVASQTEKERLAAAHGGDLVDMEAAAIARQAQAQGIEFHSLKGISDGLTDSLPDLNRFITPAGQFQTGRFAAYAALRPQHWPALIRLGRNSGRATEALAAQVHGLLEQIAAPGGRVPPAAEYD